MLTPSEHRYLAILLPIGIVAAVLVDAAVYAAVGGQLGSPWGYPGGPENGTPLGTELGIGVPVEAVSGAGQHWYNFTVESARGGLTWSDLSFQVETATGEVVQPSNDWAVFVVQESEIQAEYGLASGSWVFGQYVSPVSGETLALDTGTTSLTGEGAAFVVVGSFGEEGSLSVAIP